MSTRLSMDAIRNAVYDIPQVGTIRFKDDAYDREADSSSGHSSVHVGFVDLFAFGDLNGDGREDVVTFVSSSFGGPEIFLSLAAFINDNGTPSGTASYLIGDRIGIDSVTIERQMINLYIITQGPGDAVCCPTLHVERKLRLQNGTLRELNGR